MDHFVYSESLPSTSALSYGAKSTDLEKAQNICILADIVYLNIVLAHSASSCASLMCVVMKYDLTAGDVDFGLLALISITYAT